MLGKQLRLLLQRRSLEFCRRRSLSHRSCPRKNPKRRRKQKLKRFQNQLIHHKRLKNQGMIGKIKLMPAANLLWLSQSRRNLPQ